MCSILHFLFSSFNPQYSLMILFSNTLWRVNFNSLDSLGLSVVFDYFNIVECWLSQIIFYHFSLSLTTVFEIILVSLKYPLKSSNNSVLGLPWLFPNWFPVFISLEITVVLFFSKCPSHANFSQSFFFLSSLSFQIYY